MVVAVIMCVVSAVCFSVGYSRGVSAFQRSPTYSKETEEVLRSAALHESVRQRLGVTDGCLEFVQEKYGVACRATDERGSLLFELRAFGGHVYRVELLPFPLFVADTEELH